MVVSASNAANANNNGNANNNTASNANYVAAINPEPSAHRCRQKVSEDKESHTFHNVATGLANTGKFGRATCPDTSDGAISVLPFFINNENPIEKTIDICPHYTN